MTSFFFIHKLCVTCFLFNYVNYIIIFIIIRRKNSRLGLDDISIIQIYTRVLYDSSKSLH